MNFLRSKAEHLADHLRDSIQRGKLLEPLPGTIAWSRSLGVARDTLDRALRILRREGLVTVHSRGYRLNQRNISRASPSTTTPRVVRMLYYARDYRDLHVARDWVFLLLERLQEHGIQLQVERCSDARLAQIARQNHQTNELFFLTAFIQRHQQLFAASAKPALLLGSPATGINLPFITPDPISSVSHATSLLLRSGFTRLTLLLPPFTNPAIQNAIDAFTSTCGQWPHQPIESVSKVMPLAEKERLPAARRFARQAREREGVIVVSPVPVGLIITALLEQGIAMPGQVEVVALWPSLAAVDLCPPIRYYPAPSAQFVREIVAVTERYFESGELPDVQIRLPLDLVEPA